MFSHPFLFLFFWNPIVTLCGLCLRLKTIHYFFILFSLFCSAILSAKTTCIILPRLFFIFLGYFLSLVYVVICWLSVSSLYKSCYLSLSFSNRCINLLSLPPSLPEFLNHNTIINNYFVVTTIFLFFECEFSSHYLYTHSLSFLIFNLPCLKSAFTVEGSKLHFFIFNTLRNEVSTII